MMVSGMNTPIVETVFHQFQENISGDMEAITGNLLVQFAYTICSGLFFRNHTLCHGSLYSTPIKNCPTQELLPDSLH